MSEIGFTFILQEVYCRHIGLEYMYINSRKKCKLFFLNGAQVLQLNLRFIGLICENGNFSR